jgi:TonB family protein
MKPIYTALVVTALALAVPAGAQTGFNPDDHARLKVTQTVEPVFPLALNNSQVMSGNVTVAIDVDQNGKLTDWLVTNYSRKEFADSAIAAIQHWEFEPPRLNGKPWASVQRLYFDYSRTGVVVNLTGSDAITGRLDELMSSRYAYRTFTLRELDRIPTPIHVVSPVVSGPALRDESMHSVKVEFYIDEDGRVRLPSVGRDEVGTVYAANALDLVRQWRFEPPLYKGNKVLALVQQEFKFVVKP